MVKKHCTCSMLMTNDNKIWRKQNIDSGSDIYPRYGAPKAKWMKYQREAGKMLKGCGFSKKHKVPDKIRACLEDQNFHSLNNAIDFLGVGITRYGLTKKDFFKRM